MPMLVLTGDKASGEFLITQALALHAESIERMSSSTPAR
jgi:hypothetical protein